MSETFTRQQIVEAARSFIGVDYLHQGRNPETGLDCVGLGTAIAEKIGYSEIIDLEGYKKLPESGTVIQYLRMNLDEIPLAEVGIGDVYCMKIGTQLPCHFAVKVSDETNLEKGIQPTMIHALSTKSIKCVIEQPVRLWRSSLILGFRFRGLID
jgi:hypothetical protein